MLKRIGHFIFIPLLCTLLFACGGGNDGGDGTIVAAPASNLQVIAGDQRITLNWDAVPGADSYTVYWSNITGNGTSGTAISNISPPFYHDGLSNGANYYYVVTAVNTVGESTGSAEVTATPVDILISSLIFSDTNLDTCVKASSATYVRELSFLKCSNRSIASFVGIENLTSLTGLDLSSSNTSDITPLAGLTNLTRLFLGKNDISDVASLTRLTRLTRLALGSNSLSDVTLLAELISLTNLDLRDNKIRGQNTGNINAITSLVNATIINLSGNSGMSCTELTTLINALGSPPVNTDRNIATRDVATDGVNCTNP